MHRVKFLILLTISTLTVVPSWAQLTKSEAIRQGKIQSREGGTHGGGGSTEALFEVLTEKDEVIQALCDSMGHFNSIMAMRQSGVNTIQGDNLFAEIPVPELERLRFRFCWGDPKSVEVTDEILYDPIKKNPQDKPREVSIVNFPSKDGHEILRINGIRFLSTYESNIGRGREDLNASLAGHELISLIAGQSKENFAKFQDDVRNEYKMTRKFSSALRLFYSFLHHDQGRDFSDSEAHFIWPSDADKYNYPETIPDFYRMSLEDKLKAIYFTAFRVCTNQIFLRFNTIGPEEKPGIETKACWEAAGLNVFRGNTAARDTMEDVLRKGLTPKQVEGLLKLLEINAKLSHEVQTNYLNNTVVLEAVLSMYTQDLKKAAPWAKAAAQYLQTNSQRLNQAIKLMNGRNSHPLMSSLEDSQRSVQNPTDSN